MSAPGNHPRATLIGAAAIAIWSTLAVLTTRTGRIPPFELVGLSFAAAFGFSLLVRISRKESLLQHLRQPASAWALGVGGLFGYHFLYFLALKNAPPMAANLLNYLWPLLIVVFSALLPGEKLRAHHLLGALMGMGGAVILLLRGRDALTLDPAHMSGYLAAIGCAVVWAAYSVLNRRHAHIPTAAVGGFCGATALLALGAHALFETWVTPDWRQVLIILGMGAGPTGLAFYLWDYGTKRGDIKLLGTLAYAAPLLSTLLLTLWGTDQMDGRVGIALLLIVGGGAVGGGALSRK